LIALEGSWRCTIAGDFAGGANPYSCVRQVLHIGHGVHAEAPVEQKSDETSNEEIDSGGDARARTTPRRPIVPRRAKPCCCLRWD